MGHANYVVPSAYKMLQLDDCMNTTPRKPPGIIVEVDK